MEIINITEEQREKLCNELARLTFEFRKNKSIKGIYFAPYKGLGSIKGHVLEMTLVTSNESNDLYEEIKENNTSYQNDDSMRKFGFKIFIDIDNIRKYTIMDLNPSECIRSNNLMNSTILYDESGELSQIKEHTTSLAREHGKRLYYYYDNLAEVFPSLDETLDKALDIARMERDTNAVKDFTKSKLFQHFKDM